MSSSIPDPVPDGMTDAQLRHIINYWRIEAQSNHGRWVHAMEQNAALAAENERLRKAGDAMAKCIQPPAHGPGEYESEYDAWFAAKEGSDAK